MTFDSAAEKRRYVNAMFARIARRYDLMNHLMTGGQDVRWRRLMVQQAALTPGGRFLDMATGLMEEVFESILGLGRNHTMKDRCEPGWKNHPGAISLQTPRGYRVLFLPCIRALGR